jgi:hypothetical protein
MWRSAGLNGAASSSTREPIVTVCGSPVHVWWNLSVIPGFTVTLFGKKPQREPANSSWAQSVSIVSVSLLPPDPHAGRIAAATQSAAKRAGRERDITSRPPCRSCRDG